MNGERGYKLEKQYRLPGYDYSADGFYFVTICTKNRENFFGEIKGGRMGLNDMGCLMAQCYQEIPGYFGNVKLDEWQIMPNHLHGIIVIDNSPRIRRPMINHGPTDTGNWFKTDNQIHKKIGIKNCPMQMDQATLGGIVRWFKARSTYLTRRQLNPNFAWQPRFYDHIIRNDGEWERIAHYIKSNPLKWEQDRNNGGDLWM